MNFPENRSSKVVGGASVPFRLILSSSEVISPARSALQFPSDTGDLSISLRKASDVLLSGPEPGREGSPSLI
jgi:hypothetical protein